MIRRATLEDLESVLSIEQTFGAEAFSRRSLHRFILTKKMFVYGTPALAYCIVLNKSNSTKVRLYSIAVSESHRGMGVGSRMLTELERLARDQGMTHVRLEVSEENIAAIGLYRSRGYKVIGRILSYYESGQAAIKMEKSLILSKIAVDSYPI